MSEQEIQSREDRRLFASFSIVFAAIGFMLAIAALMTVVFAGRYDAVTPTASASTVASAAPAQQSSVTWKMYADSNKKVKGPDGNYHDAMLPGNPTVQAGAVSVTVLNYDTMQHSVTVEDLGISEMIPAAKGSTPGQKTFTINVKPGRYQWMCIMPCDPWAMTHDGYMRGWITVKA